MQLKMLIAIKIFNQIVALIFITCFNVTLCITIMLMYVSNATLRNDYIDNSNEWVSECVVGFNIPLDT